MNWAPALRMILPAWSDNLLGKFFLILKPGHCHAIWQLYKELLGVFASIEFQN